MEKIKIIKASQKYSFKEGDTFIVKRNIMAKCVVICGENEPNLILEEEELMKYGILTGTPQLCFS